MLSFFQFRRRNSDRSWFAMILWWGIVPWSVGTIGRLLWGYRTVGIQRVPRTGPALVIANHQSHLDPMFIGVAVRDRGFRALARQTLMQDLPRFIAWCMRVGYQTIQLDQDGPDPASLKASVHELKSGRLSVIFPEGERSDDGTVQPFQRGVWLLIKRSGAPVLPMGVEGTFDAWPSGGRPTLHARALLHIGELIPHQTLIKMGPDEGLSYLRQVIDDLRMKARADIRRRSRGRYPRPGPADQPLQMEPPA